MVGNKTGAAQKNSPVLDSIGDQEAPESFVVGLKIILIAPR